MFFRQSSMDCMETSAPETPLEFASMMVMTIDPVSTSA